MNRFFCNPQNITPKEINILDRDELHHMRDVLRLKSQDRAIVLDGQGGEYFTHIIKIDKNEAKLKIVDKQIHDKKSLSVRLTIACALIKRPKMNFIVEKFTELGLEKIILMETERTLIKPDDLTKRIDKLRKVSIEALKQSGVKFLPEIEFMSFKALLGVVKDFDLALLPNLSGDRVSIRDALDKLSKGRILAAIGPEGDFSDEEVDLAKKAGFTSVSLGDTALKVETAAVVTAGFIKLYL